MAARRTCTAIRFAAGIVALGLVARVAAQSPRQTAAPRGAEVFLLAGQSNMSGRGDLSALTAAERRPDPKIWLYGNDGQWRLALDPLDDATGQIDMVSADHLAAVGPGLSFARALRRQGHGAVALVPCAKGGSSIGRWKPDGARTTLYGSCLARAKEAGGRIAGILWYQGESDAQSATAAAHWRERFEQLVRGFRADLGEPNLPVVYVQIADRPARDHDRARYPGWRTVQEQQATAQARLRCSAMVSARGLELREDQLHLTTASQRILGPRLAAAMDRLVRQGCGSQTGPRT